MGGGIGMGNTCKPMAVLFQCMTKFTTKKKKKKKNAEVRAFIVFKKELIRVLKVNNFLLCSCVFDEIYSSENDEVSYSISTV